MLVLSPCTLRRYERRGLLKPMKLNARVTRYRIADVEKLLQRASVSMPVTTTPPQTPKPARGKRPGPALKLAA